MHNTNHSSSPASQQGVVLLESLIAILIFSLGVLGIVGLQAAMIKSTSEAKYRADASYIAQQRIGQMWVEGVNLGVTPAILPADLNAVVDISSLLPNGTRTVTQPVAGRLLVVVTWQQPGEAVHNFTTTASIAGG
ncbi:MAG: prepilin-type cleavage/methylation domain-containing protein [Propionivibrio sp.]|nr:prepilin-type cleavage/methylation domain-containing protein [Propionivibrio sp.]